VLASFPLRSSNEKWPKASEDESLITVMGAPHVLVNSHSVNGANHRIDVMTGSALCFFRHVVKFESLSAASPAVRGDHSV
jgi:hypothetical protein